MQGVLDPDQAEIIPKKTSLGNARLGKCMVQCQTLYKLHSRLEKPGMEFLSKIKKQIIKTQTIKNMNDEYRTIPLVKNRQRNRFELNIGDQTVFINYKERRKNIFLIHTQTPEKLKGQGAATAIIEKTLSYIERHGYTLIPICPMVKAYLKRHPDWSRILDSDKKQRSS